MRVLITGGGGFIGSHLAERLLARGDQVLVIDNYLTGSPDNLPDHEDLTRVEGSIVCPETVEDAFAGFKPEQVVHAAASYKDPRDWVTDSNTNVVGTVHVVQAAERHRVERLIYFQTSLCYGLHPRSHPIPLDHPLEPAGSYAISKTGGERYVLDSSLDAISFRLANMYGPRNLSGPVPTFYQRLTEGKRCFVADTRRDFVLVDDLLGLVLKALDGEGRRGPYNASSETDVSIKELFDAVVQALGIELEEPIEVRPRGPDDVATLLLDASATRRDFPGWAPGTSLEEGVARAVAWYREHGVKATYTHLRQED